ncbi:uncharacterized protein LOC126679589 [Mercurialis annua]|uniref:uncharacterized protein LOC126679589 n=1 Tax=Mercurialis annua TaxID=3986 RepID=UPI00215F55B9|nr:uncharacterized protein LOC126679589 [Mercurialis annua]
MSMTMNFFPSPEEQTVASALLLLSKAIPHRHHHRQSPNRFDDGRIRSLKLKQRVKSEDEQRLSTSSKSHSVSHSSTITSATEGSSSSSFQEKSKRSSLKNKLRSFAVVSSNRHELKFKVVRKKRSTVSWTVSENRKIVLALPGTASLKSESSTLSCISSSSSAASSCRSQYLMKGTPASYHHQIQKQQKRMSSGLGSSSSSGSSKLSRKSEAILKILSSGGSSSEVKIRQALGDSPDTSKALRMLLKKDEVKRSGIGGRTDPYIYKIA